LPTTSSPPAIVTHGLGKRYELGELQSLHLFLLRLMGRRGAHPGFSDFMALRDVSIEIPTGTCFGILGANGSGKSTLVHILAGIVVPSHGRAEVRGRVLPLLEIGHGFHPELTGRENVMLFGTILGFGPAEVRELLPGILEFAEIDEAHFDTPMKRYSMGMQARLSFAVAMRFPASIYVFDEVFAVVDDGFRRRAIEELRSLVNQGRTVIFISHDLPLVRLLCSEGIWLDKGSVRMQAPIDEVADAYSAEQAGHRPPPMPRGVLLEHPDEAAR
jgi:lipopolysaccharide transport system ATP-binding protein